MVSVSVTWLGDPALFWLSCLFDLSSSVSLMASPVERTHSVGIGDCSWGYVNLPDISLLCHLHLELVRHAESHTPGNLQICLLTKSWAIHMPIRVSGVAWWVPEVQILLRSVFWLGSYTPVGNLFVSCKHGWTQTIHLDGTGCTFSVSLSHCCVSLWVQVPSSLPGGPQTGQTPPFPGSTLQKPALQGWSTPPSYVTCLSTHGWQKIKKPGSFVTSLYFLVL